MNFSDSFNCNNRLCHYSPDGRFLAHVDGHYKLFIRSANTLTVYQMFTCLDEISNVSWSNDSTMVMCAMYKRSLVQIFSLENSDWTCKIDEGSYGLASAVWSSDSQSVLTTSEFHLRVTVWSLTTKSVAYIKYPKPGTNPGMEFSDDGQFMALAERREFSDFISIFLVSNWSLTSHFAVESSDLQSIRWTPDSVTLAVLDTCTEVRLLFYSVLGHLVSKIEPYQNALGIKTLAFSPTGQFAAAGFYNQSIHIIPHITWKSIARLNHPTAIKSMPKALTTCTEVRLLFYSVLGHRVSKIEPYQNALGIKTLAFSPTGQFAAAGFYNHSIHIIPHITWKSIARLNHPTAIKSMPKALTDNNSTANASTTSTNKSDILSQSVLSSECATVYKETDFRTDALSMSPIVNMQPSGPLKVKQVKYELVEQRPFEIPYTTPDPEKPNPKMGPGLLAFSCNGLYLMSRNDNQPCTVYVWNMRTLSLDSVLQHNEPVTAAQWDPIHCRLAILTGTPKVFMWSPSGCVAVRIVESGRTIPNGIDIKWHPNGNMFAIVAKHAFFMCYLDVEHKTKSSTNKEEKNELGAKVGLKNQEVAAH